MATTPYFVLSPNTVLSIIGLLHGPDKTEPNPAEDWHQATVDVVIPTFNEENNIALCLTSLARQTRKPKRIILIDDGSHDRTMEYAKSFCELNNMELIAIHRKESIGKTPTLKRQSREFDSDVEFILDGDTILESENYIDRMVQELYQGRGIASACGTILPLRDRDRRSLLTEQTLQKFMAANPDASIYPTRNWFHHLQRGITDLYRDVLYFFLQKFVYRGQMVFFGGILNPVGCAVAYRRKDLKSIVFDHYEPILGDDLTNSEDIFIGFAMNNSGFRNIQLTDVYARSQEPEVGAVPHQLYLWSSSFLQSCYYFDELVRSPFKALKRYRHHKDIKKSIDGKPSIEEQRIFKEQYRQPFGKDYTLQYGRPIGWVLFMSAIEKIGFPTAIVIMAILKLWEPLALTIGIETVLSLTILTVVARGHRWEYLFKGILVTPLRYGALLFDLLTIGRFAADLWIFRNNRWRK
jgi:glycosyltransferase involved in cell wall biosynthesis